MVLTPSRHDCLETIKLRIHILLYHRLEKMVSLSDASKLPVVSLFILRLNDKILALYNTIFFLLLLPEKFLKLSY